MKPVVMPIDFAGAEKLLRRAEFFRDFLQHQSKEISRDFFQARDRDYRFALENFFSASLNAAQSAFYLLQETGGPQFKQICSQWRNHTLDQLGRRRLNALMRLRDRDVHFGELPGEVLSKMIPMDISHDMNHHNALTFGPRYMTEHQNPDGTVVRAYGGLRGSLGLYVEIAGERTDAVTASTDFINKLRSLLQEAEANIAGETEISREPG